MREKVFLSQAEIRRTAKLIWPHTRRTPVLEVRGEDFGLAVPSLVLKLELFQHSGSFKARGAFANLLMRRIPPAGVVAASGGNHGAAVAYAAMKLKTPAKIFIPTVASPVKVARIRGYGAELVVTGERYADSLAASEQELAVSKAALEKDRALYAYSHITAPFDGVITEMDAYTGALLPAGTSSNKGDLALCHISQNSLLRLVIPVPERVVADIHIGDSVKVHVAGLNDTFTGKIVRFSDNIDLETRTMHTEVDVPNPNYQIVPGMYATVDLPLHVVRGVVTVPIQAVERSGEDRGTVLVVGSDHRLERREVTLGIESASYIEVVSGLKENETVVFGEQSEYKLGELVKARVVTPAGSE